MKNFGLYSKFARIVLFFCLIISYGSLYTPLQAQQLDSSDVVHMRQRIRMLKSANPPRPGSVQELLKSMQADGSWKTINYNSIAVSHWGPGNHLSYVMDMAKAYANPDSPLFQNKGLVNGLHKALDYWLNHNFTSRNWWQNDIGIPKKLGDILILMGDQVTSEELLQALNQMRGSYISQTGQNKVWRAEIQLNIGLLEFGKGRTNLLGSPEERIKKASKVLHDEVVVQAKEGIQSDWSFHQHGIQQQFGNYGLSFVGSQSEWAFVLKDTPYEYSKQKIKILREYILKGLSRVIWKGVMDISDAGRQIFPDSPAEKGSAVIHVLQLMSKTDAEHASMYQQVINYNLGKTSQPSFLKGNRYFWRSDLMVERSIDSYFSVRMCSKKIQSTESGNVENMHAAHLSDGATYLYRTNQEYHNIFTVWNWHRIPGVTSYAKGTLPKVGWRGLHNGSDFVGGLSDSTYGANVMFLKRNGLSAHKAWFFMPDGMVCLGTGIKSNQRKDVFTTLNQSLFNGKIILKKNEAREILGLGQHMESAGIKWVYHDKTGYFFLSKEQVHVGAATQRGSWHKVYDNGSKKMICKQVFNLWVDHGSNPQKGSYAYMVLPDITQDELNRFEENSVVKILQNTSSLQAIQDSEKKLTQMIFYQPGRVKLNKSTTISTDTSCMLMVQQIGKKLKITISAPPELRKQVELTITGHYTGLHCTYNSQKNRTKVEFNVPIGTQAGQSVIRILHTL